MCLLRSCPIDMCLSGIVFRKPFIAKSDQAVRLAEQQFGDVQVRDPGVIRQFPQVQKRIFRWDRYSSSALSNGILVSRAT
jgi:hypothetical protein